MITGLLLVPIARGLEVSAPVPGEPDRPNHVTVSWATPGQTLALWAGQPDGEGVAGDCVLGLSEPVLLGEGTADADGTVRFTFDVPATSVGVREGLQAVQLNACTTSPVRDVTWTVNAWVGLWNIAATDVRVHGNATVGVFGSRVRVDGDLDGDGFGDLLVSGPLEGEAGQMSGSVYVFSNPTPGTWLADAQELLELTGEGPYEWAGFGLAYADVDADGFDDVWVGARLASGGVGAAYLVRSPRTGSSVSLSEADTKLVGESLDQVGMDVASAGDVDGDGGADVWIGAPYAAALAGTVFLVPGTVRGVHPIRGVALAEWQGTGAFDALGQRLSGIGDVDGDGIGEAAVGAESFDAAGVDAGAAFVLSGAERGVRSIADADATWLGEVPGDFAGASTPAIGDLDGDGYTDLAVGARGVSAGTLYLVYGPFPAEASLAEARTKLIGEADEDYAGAHATGCDLDGDGQRDLIVGAHGAGPGVEAGRVYVFYGAPADGELSVGTADAIFQGEDPSKAGQDVSCADMDADGVDDLAFGAEGEPSIGGAPYAGAVHIAYGRSRTSDRAEEDTGVPEEAPGCACASDGPTGGGWALLTALGVWFRTTGRTPLRFRRR